MATPTDPNSDDGSQTWQSGQQRLARLRLIAVIGWTLWYWVWASPTLVAAGWLKTAVYLGVGTSIWAAFAVQIDYVLPRRLGILRRPFMPWLGQRLKAVAFEAVFLAAAAGPLPWAMRQWPHHWWLPITIWLAGLWLAWTWALPSLVLPRLMRTEALPDDSLKESVRTLVQAFGLAVEVRVWHVSDGSASMQAATVGLGSTRRILVTDTLLAGCEPDEVIGIIAHELAHLASHDLLRRGMATIVAMGLVLATAALLETGTLLDLSGLVVAVTVSVGWYFRYLRQLEFAADGRAVAATGNGWAYGNALRKVANANRESHAPGPDSFCQMHPALPVRLRRLGLEE